jgi:hypothetical protein
MTESEVAAMPAGGHAILYQTRQAIERRALGLLASLYESGDIPVADAQAEEHGLIGHSENPLTQPQNSLNQPLGISFGE